MLAIRLQRTGRKGHAQYRVVVQDARRAPSSGKVIKYVGHYNPHTKQAVIKKEDVEFYLQHGAQPSDRVARLIKAEGVKLPKWVVLAAPKKRSTKNPDKLKKAEEVQVESTPTEASADQPAAESNDSTEASVAEQTAEAPAEEKASGESPQDADKLEEKEKSA